MSGPASDEITPIHAVIPTERFWPEYTGWIKQTLTMASACSDSLCFTAVSRPSSARPDEPLPSNVSRHSVGVESSRSGMYWQLQYVLLALIYVTRHRYNIDVVYLPYVFFPGFIFLVAGALLRIPTVARISGQEVAPNRSLAARLRRWALRTANAVIVLNHHDDNRLEELGIDPERVVYIPNGVDTTRFSPASAEKKKKLRSCLDLPAERPIVAFAGIICRRKGVQELLDAFEQVLKRIGADEPKPYLVLAGPVRAVEEAEVEYVCQVQSRARDLSDHVRMPGKIDYVPELFRASDIFVLPSYAEGMPNVLLEAMATGLPCVATDISGIREVIQNGKNGKLFSPVDIDELASNTFNLLKDPECQMLCSQSARDTVESEFSIMRTSSMYRRVFKSVVNKESTLIHRRNLSYSRE